MSNVIVNSFSIMYTVSNGTQGGYSMFLGLVITPSSDGTSGSITGSATVYHGGKIILESPVTGQYYLVGDEIQMILASPILIRTVPELSAILKLSNWTGGTGAYTFLGPDGWVRVRNADVVEDFPVAKPELVK